MTRKPTPAEMGLDVTIAIAAITQPDGHIVTVSDRMISYDDITQAEDDAALKGQKIGDKWGVMFAGNDARIFSPLVDKIIVKMRGVVKPEGDYAILDVKAAVRDSYQEMFEEEFSAAFLSRLRIPNVTAFRKSGFEELGPEVYHQVYRELAKYDLGIQLVCYGYDWIGYPHIFEVNNPGKIEDRDLLNYAVIGSGYWMATASLRRRPMSRFLNETVYRLLEAKFSAETATGVGKATTLFIFGKNDQFQSLPENKIDDIRAEWQKTLRPEAPARVIEVIGNTVNMTPKTKTDAPSVPALLPPAQPSQTPSQSSGDLPPPQESGQPQ